MTEAQIIQAVRRGARDVGVVHFSDDEVRDQILVAVQMLGLKIEEADASYFHRRTSLSSDTPVFPWPSDCAKIIGVWDLDANAGDITDASNTSPIVITCAAHGRATGNVVTVHDVGGNTAANGIWSITKLTDDTYSLDSSAGTAAYTTGGKEFSEPNNLDGQRMSRISPLEATGEDDRSWFPRGKNVVVDHTDFTNDLMVDYRMVPSEISDIPDEFHFGVVSFCTWNLIVLPRPEDPDYADKANIYATHTRQWQYCNDRILETMRPSSEPSYVRDEIGD